MSAIRRLALLLAISASLGAGAALSGVGQPALAADGALGGALAAGPKPLPPLPIPAPDTTQGALEIEQWSLSEIADAKRACASVAAETSARFEILPPRRQGACGAPAPIRLESIGEEAPVRFVPAPVITCNMVAGLAQWIDRALKALGERHLDAAVSEVRVMSSYACRSRYGRVGARMSEHAFANALDIAGFRLSDGREIMVLSDWGTTRRDLVGAAGPATEPGDLILPPAPAAATTPADAVKDSRRITETEAALPPPPVRRPPGKATEASAAGPAAVRKAARPPSKWTARGAGPRRPQKSSGPPSAPSRATPSAASGPARNAMRFLRESHRIACAIFGTTLGPEANEAHRDHLHVDMFPRRNGGYCE